MNVCHLWRKALNLYNLEKDKDLSMEKYF